MEIPDTKMVKRYRIVALIKNENKPKERRCNGSVMMLNKGLTIRNNMDNTIPPIIYVVSPPFTFTPSKTCEVTNRAVE